MKTRVEKVLQKGYCCHSYFLKRRYFGSNFLSVATLLELACCEDFGHRNGLSTEYECRYRTIIQVQTSLWIHLSLMIIIDALQVLPDVLKLTDPPSLYLHMEDFVYQEGTHDPEYSLKRCSHSTRNDPHNTQTVISRMK